MISLVIPIYNEETIIDELIERCLNVLGELSNDYEIMLVDDGSRDGSMKKMLQQRDRNKRIKILSLSKNFGHQAAITAGLEHVKGDFIAMMDGDLQDPPEHIREMYMKLESGEYDVINGIRKARKGGIGKRIVLNSFHRIFKRVSGLNEIENTGNFSMINRKALTGLLEIKEKSRYLPGLRSFIGYKQGNIEYVRQERKHGKPKMSMWKLLTLGFDAVFSFSKIPLKICFFLGTVGIIVFLLAVVYIILSKIFGLAPLGWSSTMMSIFFLGSIQLIFLGVLGEYIFKIYKETQNRPIYLVKEFHDD